MHTYLVQYVIGDGNGWALINCTSPNYIKGILKTQSKFSNAEITAYRELKNFGGKINQLVYEGSIVTLGNNAYEIALQHGFTGTEEEWLASIAGAKGEKGDKGDSGPQGPKGPKGYDGLPEKDACVNGHNTVIIEGQGHISVTQNGNKLIISITDVATAQQGSLAETAYQKPENGIPASDLASGVIPVVPTNVSTFTNDAGYITQHQDISGKADKVLNPTSGNFAALDNNGNITDSGKKASDFLAQHQDLSNYVQKSQTAGLLKNDGTVDTNTYLTQHQSLSGLENTSNKVTSVSSSSTNEQYPSAKLLYDKLGEKQNVIDSSHKLDYSLLSNTPTIPTVPTISTNIATDYDNDAKTASPKAVKTYVDNLIGNIETLLASI